MISCPIKLCTEYSFSGYGIQRSFYRLIELDLKSSFNYYPPLLLGILFTLIFFIFKAKFKSFNLFELNYYIFKLYNHFILKKNHIFEKFSKAKNIFNLKK